MLDPAFKAAIEELLPRVETPFYAYDQRAFLREAEGFRRAFPEAWPLYALKANPRLFFLRALRELGYGLEAVSLGEVLRGYRAGFLPSEVLLNGPVKTPAALSALAQAGVPRIGVDSRADLERVARLLPGAEVLIRVNPDLPVATHPHLATGRGESQFGVLPEEVPALWRRAGELGLRPLGLHLHLGSAIERAQDFEAGYRVVEGLLDLLPGVRVVDLGGGFGLELDLAALAPRVAAFARRVEEVWLEPGRRLVARAGVLVTRVWGEKRTRRRYLLLDAGMTAFLRPALYGARPPVVPLYKSEEEGVFDLAGPACESTDVLAREVRLPVPREGDALLVLEAGAYGASMANRYLDTPRPAEYLFDGERWHELRPKEGYPELFAGERF